jgi:hypothetical protein
MTRDADEKRAIYVAVRGQDNMDTADHAAALIARPQFAPVDADVTKILQNKNQ